MIEARAGAFLGAVLRDRTWYGAPVLRVGVVVIGRNEGERLRRCLESLAPAGAPVVYVDSGSTDGSVAWARPRCRSVVELDLSVPFTAARARNAGVERLLQLEPDLELVQFVDGDCEIAPGWLEAGARALAADARLGVVFGRLRERFPERSVYNLLCDIEWNTPVGPARSCGGNSLMRVRAFREAGGFDPGVIAGEDDELCVRIRAGGWTVERVDAEMGNHDAAMTRFGQWWRRATRAGHCYAQGFAMHGRTPERMWSRNLRGTIVSGLLVPAAALAGAWPTRGLSLVLLAWYPALLARISRGARRRGLPASHARTFAAFCVLAKFPEVLGVARYLVSRARRRQTPIIEYRKTETT